MNKTAMKSQWKQLRGEIKSEWAKLTDNDLLRMEGELDKMVGLFQKRYGYTREHALETLTHYVEGYRQRAKEFVAEGIEFVRPRANEATQMITPARPSINMVAIASLVLTAAAVVLVRFMMQREE